MDGFATHQPFTLRFALQAAMRGHRLLELGCGDYSTPLLQEVAAAFPQSGFDSFSADPVWSKRFPNTTVIPSWDGWTPPRSYGFCLLDNELRVRDRFAMLPMLLKSAAVVVLHDAEILERDGIIVSQTTDDYCRYALYELGTHKTAVFWSRFVPAS